MVKTRILPSRWCAALAAVWAALPVALSGGAEASRAGDDDPTTCREGDQAAVVFFVLEDCPVANALVPAMNRIVEDYREKGVRFTFVYVDPKMDSGAVDAHRKAFRLAAPAVIDRDHRWVDKAGAEVTPEAAVFAKGGERVYRGRVNNLYVGFGEKRQVVTERDLRAALDAVLAGKDKVPPAKGKAVGCYIRDFRPEDGP
jgi:thiol-disulfide isomerase/thioredoxin